MRKYTITYEVQRGKRVAIVRRGSERLPIEKYRHFRHDELELSKYVKRLNDKLNPIYTIELKHAFISPQLLDKYRNLLYSQITNRKTANCEHMYVVKYFLNYFIHTEQLNDPVDWHRNHKTGWAKFLLDLKLAPSTKKQIIYAANSFMKWLRTERPEIPELKFEPISSARFKEMTATRKMNKEQRETYFIPERDWNLIVTSAPKQLSPFIKICYLLGLRRSESMALQLTDVKKGYLLVERQLLKVGGFGPTKGRLTRRVPYWFTSPQEVYNLVSQAAEIKLHPSNLSKLWDEHMQNLNMEYTLHDLRHTWITRAMRTQIPRDVQLAAGHVNIQTTMGYLHDDRNLDDEEFKPVA